MAVRNGDLIKLVIAGNVLNAEVTNDWGVDVDEIDVTTKDSSGWKEFIAGEGSGQVNFEGKYDDAATYAYSQVFAAAKAKTAITAVYGLNQVGNTAYSFSVIVTNITLNGPKNDAATFSGTLRMTGEPTEITVT